MNSGGNNGKKGVKQACEAATPWLFDYVCRTGELNQAREDLVKQHLAGCPDCRETARDMAAVVSILHAAAQPAMDKTQHLSANRRRRILDSLR